MGEVEQDIENSDENVEHGHNEPANDVAAVSEDKEFEETTGVKNENEGKDEDEHKQLMIEQETDTKYGAREHSFKLRPSR